MTYYRSYRGFGLNAIWFLIGINIILFIARVIYPDLILFFGLHPAGFSARPWTIVTNLFIHSGIWHILANMITLYFFGSFLTRLVGQRSFLIIYFLGGILGNLVYMLLASPFSIAIGASGAVFALGGALTVLRPKLRVFVFPIPAPLPLWVAIIGVFFVISFFPGVAWQAHLGGLVFGLVAGSFFRRRERRYF
jgi:membrane associated rhomboid family serine protease